MNDTTTLAQQMVTAPVASRHVNLGKDPKRIAPGCRPGALLLLAD
ncbi:hypothetical protein [Hymenobacter glacieicola]|nr:hypothetical protein [Hymenobacter glacieicola]